MQDEKIITVYNSVDKLEAERLTALLEAEGIDAYVMNINNQHLFGLGSNFSHPRMVGIYSDYCCNRDSAFPGYSWFSSIPENG